jgi:hypothetical protein
MTTGSNITAASFKTIQDKADRLLGSGDGSRGYGQTVQSTDYSVGTRIEKAQWDLLRFDIINIRTHQDGSPPPIVTANIGDVISFGAASTNTNSDTLLETATINRFNIGPGRSIVSAINTRTFTSNWSSQAQCTLTATFSNADQARHFFNSGGKIRILSSRTGGAPTQQNNAWTNILSSVGLKEFGANTNPTVNFYTLTNAYQIFHQNSLSTPYSANNYRLEARCNVSNNSNGTATVVEIRVSLNDLYVDPASPPHTPSTVLPIDSIDGTLSIVFEELKATGALVPSGTFTITGPAYSVSSITAS